MVGLCAGGSSLLLGDAPVEIRVWIKESRQECGAISEEPLPLCAALDANGENILPAYCFRSSRILFKHTHRWNKRTNECAHEIGILSSSDPLVWPSVGGNQGNIICALVAVAEST